MLVDEWQIYREPRTVMYTVSSAPSKMAYIYSCRIIDRGQERTVSETQFGTVILTRNEAERLPRFIELVAGTSPL
jgi:hypothetical protein